MIFIFHLIGLTKPCEAEGCDREFKPRSITDTRQKPVDLERARLCCRTCANITIANRPEARAKKSVTMKARWQDPEMRAKMISGIKKTYE